VAPTKGDGVVAAACGLRSDLPGSSSCRRSVRSLPRSRALVTGTVASVQLARSSFGQRYQIKRDLEILRELPDGDVRTRLATRIEASVQLLLNREADRQRPPAFAVALTFFYLLAAAGAFICGAVLNLWGAYLVGAYVAVAILWAWGWRLLRLRRLGRAGGGGTPAEAARREGATQSRSRRQRDS
jgi:hypothetical protein